MPWTSNKQDWSDEELLCSAGRGDEEAFSILCEQRLLPLMEWLDELCRAQGVTIENDMVYNLAECTIHKAVELVRRNGHLPRGAAGGKWLKEFAGKELEGWLRTWAPDATDGQFSHEAIIEEVCDIIDWLEHDQARIIRMVLRDGRLAEDAGSELGMEARESRQLYEKALERLQQIIECHGRDSSGGSANRD